MQRIELWGGSECTLVRTGDAYLDQTVLNGHQRRPEDIDSFAALGIAAIRYPVLWERVAPDGLEAADWRWTDERLGRLRELGVRPIAGLVHHGSGPRSTSLSDPAFAEKLAAYALRAAERYPWIEEWTPVNEPLTTARFSGLYGHWYPHGRDDRGFLEMLLNQIDAVRLSMRAIRSVNPRARLIQTEDIGKIHSTPRLAHQAAFENERRWLSCDLLLGRIGPDHPMRRYFQATGLEARLDATQADPCPPDVIGFNHYLSSERLIDERMERYPPHTHGGNGRDRYADVEATRVVAEGAVGFEGLLREAWDRYRMPLAVTEAHNGSSREEQLRWLKEVWDGAVRLRDEGVDMRAVTVWSLLGTYDWNTLLTRPTGFYESGVFDVRGPRPRPTAVAAMVSSLARTGEADHPVLDVPGWWHRPDRFFWPPVRSRPYVVPLVAAGAPARWTAPRHLLITGATGTLGRAFARHCSLRGLPYHLLGRREMDICDPRAAATLARLNPWAVINAAGYVRVDEAERDADRCRRENTGGAVALAEACAELGIPLVTFSSDLVFDGTKGEAYVESDRTAPLSVYGASKAEAEAAVLGACPSALVVRTSAFFGPWDPHNFVTWAVAGMRSGRRVPAAADVRVSPTYVPDLVDWCLDLLIDGERGIWHLSSAGEASWAELARMAAERLGLDRTLVEARPAAEMGWSARRPANAALRSERGGGMPALDDALARYAASVVAGSSAEWGPAEGLEEYLRARRAH
jgi:dTDP-4-dehydrorhamnose reductase